MALTAQEEALVRQLLDEQAAILSLASSEPTILSKLGATKKNLSDLTSASAINDADLLLLRQGTSDKSVTGAIFKSLIPTIADASTTVKGIVELATDAEAQTGTDTVRAITPANLASVTATETRAGLIEIATDAEAQAFTANKAIDGEKLKSAFNASGSAPLYGCRAWVNFNGTGTVAIRASGNVSSITDNGAGDYTVNFSSNMPDANYSVSGSGNRDNSFNQTSIFGLANFTNTIKSTSQVRVLNMLQNGALSDGEQMSVTIHR